MLVKKYANRRLYDTEESRYITQDELASRIRFGADPTVVDAKTGEDLTQSVLAQLILDSRGAAKLLPVPLLIRLIRLGDDALAEFFGRYVSWSLDLYLSARQGAQKMVPFNPFAVAQAPMDITQALGRILGGFAQQQHPHAPPAPPPPVTVVDPTPPPHPDDEMAALRAEMAALRKQMDGLDKGD